MELENMVETFVAVDEIPTLVAMWGKTLDDNLADVKEIIVFLVGNPGIPGFYYEFLQQIYDKMDGKIPVWAIGGAGHNYPPNARQTVPELKGYKNKYDLKGQIDNKVRFIREQIPDHIKLTMLGHSMGALYTLNMLKESDIKARLKRCYMLFPVVERMGETPRGPAFKNLFIDKYLLLKFIYTLFYILPVFVRNFLLISYFRLMRHPTKFRKSFLDYINPSVLEKSVFLTKDVIDNVKTLDYEFVEKNKNLLKFFYGTRDGWAPVSYYNELVYNVPDIDAELDKTNMPHTFVFSRNNTMADIVSNWIRQDGGEDGGDSGNKKIK